MDGSSRPAGGSLGPRLAGRLTAELIGRSPQYMSCVRYYEIDLRGNKIGAIENLGVTENQFDSIDLSDNAIVRLEGFPRLPRLKMLLLNNNRVAKVARGLESAVQNLETLVLTNNRIAELKDIDPLATLPKLTHLSLAGNPVATKPHYRLYAISKLPHLKVLDFKKVKLQERKAGADLFGSGGAAAAAAGNTFEPGEGVPEAEAPPAAADAAAEEDEEQQQEEEDEEQEADGQEQQQQQQHANGGPAKPGGAPTLEQLTAVKAAVANAQTIQEAWALEQALKAGHLPSTYQLGAGPAAAAAAAATAAGPPAADGSGAADAMEEG